MNHTGKKTVRHFHEPGDLHELTFSCDRQKQLLVDDDWRKLLSRSIDAAFQGHRCRLVALVFLPEHVHLLVDPLDKEPQIDLLLSAVERPYSFRIKQLLLSRGDPLVKELTVQERPGKKAFRYWQEGPGYDRNLSAEQAILSAIDYIHYKPVRRGLVEWARDWKWSSARWYESDKQDIDPDLPHIHGLRWEISSP